MNEEYRRYFEKAARTLMKTSVIGALAAGLACGSETAPARATKPDASTTGASPDGDSSEDGATNTSATCTELKKAYAKLPDDPTHVSCEKDEDCTLVHDGICSWTGEISLNARGVAAHDSIRTRYDDANCNSPDCGNGGGMSFPAGCRAATCVRLLPDGGVLDES